MTIESITGSVVTRGSGSLRIVAFFRLTAKGKEQPLFLAEKDPHSGVKIIGAPDIIQSGPQRTGQVWSKKRHNFNNGGFIKFVITRTMPGSGAFGQTQTNLMLKANPDGPLNRIRIDFPTDAQSRQSVGYIDGRFDLLSDDDLVELGLDKNVQGSSELATYDRSEIDWISVEELEPPLRKATEQKVVAVNSKREKTMGAKTLLKPRRGRNIRG